MPRPRTERYLLLKQELIQRIQTEGWRPGDKFLTNRELCDAYQVCYVTAQSLMQELCREGYLERQSTAGTFIPGIPFHFDAVQLIFHRQAEKPGTYGKALFEALVGLLEQASIPWAFVRADKWQECPVRHYPVLWERDFLGIALKLGATRSFGLLLNQAPPVGKAGIYLDSICLNFFSAGVLAGQILKERSATDRAMVLRGPVEHMADSLECIRGIQTIWPEIEVAIITHGPFRKRSFAEALAQGTQNIFCLSQGIAAGLKAHCRQQGLQCPHMAVLCYPPVVRNLNLPVITVSLDDILQAAMRTIKSRMAGGASVAGLITLTPRATP